MELSQYSPDSLIAFRFIDSKYFVSKEVKEGSRVFLEYLISGKVNVYYVRDKAGDHYYIDKEDMKLVEITYTEAIRYVDDRKVLFRSNRHIEPISYYMEDAPSLQKKIKTITKPEHKSLVKIAENYHNTVCEGEKCIIYNKPVPLLVVMPELVGGAINYPNIAKAQGSFFFHSGIIGHFWMPCSSEKLYFRTGWMFLSTNFTESSVSKIPCQLEYIYSNGIIRPRLAYGVNFYLPSHTNALSIGANAKLSNRAFLSLTSDLAVRPRIFLFLRSSSLMPFMSVFL